MTDGGSERWLTSGVKGIGGASLLADLGHESPTSLLTSLLTSTLGAPAAALGLIEGIADGVAGAARFGGGVLADDPERRRAVAVGGYTVTAILSSLIGLATAVWQVAVLRIGAWLARGIRVPARNALLADITGPGTYGRAYGFERMMDNLGAVGGPLLALGLVAVLGIRGAIALLLYAGHNLAAMVVSIPAGKAADRWGFRPTLTTGFMVGLAAYLTFGLIGPSIPLLVLAFILAGVTIGIVETAEHGTVAEAAPEDIRGSAFGFLAAIESFGNLAASGTAGLLWTLVSPLAAFLFAAGGMTSPWPLRFGQGRDSQVEPATVNTGPVIRIVLATAMGLAETALMADGS